MKFKPEDFNPKGYLEFTILAQQCADIANAKVQKWLDNGGLEELLTARESKILKGEQE